MKPLSGDLRQRIVQVYENTTLSYHEVAGRFQVSESSVQRYVRQQRKHGHLDPAQPGGGAPRKLDAASQAWLIGVAEQQVDASQDELRQELQAKTGITVSQTTICRLLQRAGITRKKNETGHGTGHAGSEGGTSDVCGAASPDPARGCGGD